MAKLTDRQQAVLNYISDSIEARGFPPTLREIGNHLGIRSTNGVNDHLRALERKGFLTREDMKSRTLRPTSLGRSSKATAGEMGDEVETLAVPIVGRVAAGALSEAIEEPEGTLHMDRSLIGRGQKMFALRIKGESMIEAGIHDGDLVFVRQQETATRGQIIIALIGEEATCKYYFPERDHVRLEPANSTMAPILIPKNDWQSTQVIGVVTGVYRQL